MIKNNNLIVLFTPLFILSVIFYLPNSGGFGYSLPFNSVALLSLGLIIFVLIQLACSNSEFSIDNFFKASCVLIIALLIPLIWSNEAQLYKSLPRFFTILIGLAFYFSLLQLKSNDSQLIHLLLLICVSTFISSCFALYQNYLMTSDSYFAIKIEYGRPTGIFQQVNVLASYTATGLAISLYLLSSIKSKLTSNLLLFCILINFWVLFLTQSRTGLLAGLIIAIYYIFFLIKKRNLKRLTLLLALLGTSFMLAKTIPYSAGNNYVTKKEVISSPQVRINIYQDSLELFKQKPFFGHGYGSFHRVLIDHSATKIKQRDNINYGVKVTHPHNELLLWIVEGGLVAGIPILILFGYFCYLIFSSRAVNKVGLLLLITPIVLHTLTEHPFYQSTLHFATFIALVFIVLKLCHVGNSLININVSIVKISNLVVFIMLTTFSLTALQSSSILRQYIYEAPNNHLLLSKTLNPFVEYKFKEIQINSLKLETALQQKNYNGVINFIAWSESFLQAYPSDYVYFETIRAMKALSMNKAANTLTIKAKHLYPKNNSWDKGVWKPSNS